MSDNPSASALSSSNNSAQASVSAAPQPLTKLERRVLGVLMEKARTTPDAYPLSLNGLVTGCNQKSNRAPLMDLTSEQVEDVLIAMRQKQLVAEVHSGGRVPKYRHLGYDYMGVKGTEAAVMTELLLRGEQTIGELRTRAGRFEPIADLTALQQVLDRLIERGLVVELTPAGRGQMITHGLYQPHEMERLRESVSQLGTADDSSESVSSSHRSTGSSSGAAAPWMEELQELRELVSELQQRVEALENR